MNQGHASKLVQTSAHCFKPS